MTQLTLKELAAKAIGEFSEVRGARKPTFEPNKAYELEITAAEATVTKTGRHQLQISVSKVREDGSLKNSGNIWLDLPIFSDVEEESNDQEKLAKIRGIRTENLMQLLASALPEVLGYGKGTAKERGAATHAIASSFIEGSPLVDLAGRRVFLVQVPNTKSENFPYNNWYAGAPDKYDLAKNI